MNKIALTDQIKTSVKRKQGNGVDINLRGFFTLTHRDPHGNVISEETVENLITNEGKDYVLDAALHNSDNVADWYFSIFTSGSAAAGNTYATPNRTESTNYTEANRQSWGEGAASSQSITNASAATITADTGGITVTGIGVVGSPTGATGDDTKGNTACADGVLLSDVDVAKTLAQSETLDITYTVNA
jgi:hypothetical protein